MAIFKILEGPSSRIDLETTPYHKGWAYFTPDDGGLYIDSEVNGAPKRIRVNPESTAVSATLSASAWSGGEQTVSVAGVTASTNGVVGVSQDISDGQMEAAMNAALYICGQGVNYITIAAFGDTPTIDIPIVAILLS